MTTRPELLIFDVNETLLDLLPLHTEVDRLLKAKGASIAWFQKLLHQSLVETVSGGHVGFGQMAKDILAAMAVQRGVEASHLDVESVTAHIRKLPPHADVVAGLSAMAIADIPMVALTNGGADAATEQLEQAGLTPFFKRIFSVDEVGKFKPHPATYLHVTTAMGVYPSEAMMVAAHDWDILGAQRAGLRGCYIDRAGVGWLPAQHPPDHSCADLRAAAKYLINKT